MVLDTETEETACNWLFTAFLRPMVLDTIYSRKTPKIGKLRPFFGFPMLSNSGNHESSYRQRNHAILKNRLF